MIIPTRKQELPFETDGNTPRRAPTEATSRRRPRPLQKRHAHAHIPLSLRPAPTPTAHARVTGQSHHRLPIPRRIASIACCSPSPSPACYPASPPRRPPPRLQPGLAPSPRAARSPRPPKPPLLRSARWSPSGLLRGWRRRRRSRRGGRSGSGSCAAGPPPSGASRLTPRAPCSITSRSAFRFDMSRRGELTLVFKGLTAWGLGQRLVTLLKKSCCLADKEMLDAG